ncbi:zinc finger domain-containing protein [Pseudonocardia parietis]|uniref:DNA-binding phage zinc finger domain-containing protein n=1 Tax=Pseudonocardia parietis TaxID=570936 RepID=A0ABS4W240_9PSEU|nr:hypothetical protein [Pseudonocardia parietis]MBP2370273.1 hypothetical protein [Pseudonocardia parietis]
MTELDRYGHPVERVRPERPPQPRPLTADEIGQIVDLVVAYTRREPDRTMIQVWTAQSQIGRWTAPEAIAAIHRWGASRGPNDFLEPSDVTRTVRAERADRARRDEAARLAAAPPADPASRARIDQVIGRLSSRLGWPADPGDDDGATRRGVLDRVCPHCKAGPGARCVGPAGKPLTLSPHHPARVAAAGEAEPCES